MLAFILYSSIDVKTFRRQTLNAGGIEYMATFEIEGKEYELKLTFESVKRLNKAFDGGSAEVIGLSIAGDLDAFPIIVHAALLHTKEGFTMAKVNKAIEEAFEKELITFHDIQQITNEVVTDSFFYRPTVKMILKEQPEIQKALDALLGKED